jgi:hypothetical protein
MSKKIIEEWVTNRQEIRSIKHNPPTNNHLESTAWSDKAVDQDVVVFPEIEES